MAIGYVAMSGLPDYDALVKLSDCQLGSASIEPSSPTPPPGPAHTADDRLAQVQNLYDTASRGLAQTLGPIAAYDVAPNLSPANTVQITEELLTARLAYRCSVTQMFNIECTPDTIHGAAFAAAPAPDCILEPEAAL